MKVARSRGQRGQILDGRKAGESNELNSKKVVYIKSMKIEVFE